MLNSSWVPRVVAIRGGWPAWLTFKVNCLISSDYYIITARDRGASLRTRVKCHIGKDFENWKLPETLRGTCCENSNFEQLWSCSITLKLRLELTSQATVVHVVIRVLHPLCLSTQMAALGLLPSTKKYFEILQSSPICFTLYAIYAGIKLH